MAAGTSQREYYIPHIKVSAFPDLVSNFQFLDYAGIADDIANDSFNRLKELQYEVELDQIVTGAGGPGMLPSFLELLQQLWDNKLFISIPFTVGKFIYGQFKNRKAKLPAQSKRLAKVTVSLQAYSPTLRLENGIFAAKESIVNTLLEAAIIISPMLQEKYPNIHFSFLLEIKLDEHHAQLTYILKSNQLNYKRLSVLARTVAMGENTLTTVSVSKVILFKRVDVEVESNSVGSIWSLNSKLRAKTYYYLVPGRIFLKDYKRMNSR